jgi:hypothetical protein
MLEPVRVCKTLRKCAKHEEKKCALIWESMLEAENKGLKVSSCAVS